MHRQPAAVFVICLFAEQIEKLAIGQADEKVEAGIRVRHDEKQRGALVADGIKRQLIVRSDLPQLLNVKDGKARAAAHQNGLCRFARRHLVLLVLPNRKMFWLSLGQIVEYLINLVAKALVVLPHLHLIQHVDQRRKVLLLRRQLVMDVADQGDVQQRFGLDPEILSGFAFTFCVGD